LEHLFFPKTLQILIDFLCWKFVSLNILRLKFNIWIWILTIFWCDHLIMSRFFMLFEYILARIFKSNSFLNIYIGWAKKKNSLLNNAQNVSMLIRWHYDYPKLKGFYFEISCERLFGYFHALGLRITKPIMLWKF